MKMRKFTRLTATAAPLMQDNIDTDTIVRVERLVALRAGQFGPYLFEGMRYRDGGEENPEFILNLPGYRGAEILVAGANFGCGSSRESAVWSLADFGIRCIVAPSFGEIFRNNCVQNGLLPIQLPAAEVQLIADQIAPGSNRNDLTVDLETGMIAGPDGTVTVFSIDPLSRRILMSGKDAIALTMNMIGDVDAFQASDRKRRPWVYRL